MDGHAPLVVVVGDITRVRGIRPAAPLLSVRPFHKHVSFLENTSREMCIRDREIAQTIGVSLTNQNDGVYSFDTDFLVVIGADWA